MNRDEQRDLRIDDDDAVVIRETEVTVISAGDASRRDVSAEDVSAEDDTAEIRANIEHTRAEMSETINALQDRLSPTNIKEQAKEQVREQFYEAKEMVRDATIGRVENMMHSAGDTVNDARNTMMETIRQNPIPAALVGIGLGWLFMNRQSTSSQRVQISGRGSIRGGQQYYGGQQQYGGQQYYDDRRGYDNNYRPDYYADQRGGGMYQGQGTGGGTMDRARSAASNVAGSVSDSASNVASTVSSTASNVASSVSDTASNVASSVSDTASNFADQAQYQARRVEDRFETTLRTNPLAVGAIALALGTAVGLALPQTERENELMGETRDNLVERAQEVASDTMERVQRVAGEVATEAKHTAQEQAREQGLSS